jgi:hypothetical protein
MSTVTAHIVVKSGTRYPAEKLLAALTPERLEAAAIAGGLKIVNAAKRNAPVLTGTLRRSIHIGGHTDLSGGLGGNAKDLGRGEMTNTKVTIRIGTNLDYAPRIEYGFTGTDSRGSHYHQPPHAYLRPAFDEHKDEAIAETAEALRILVRKRLPAL